MNQQLPPPATSGATPAATPVQSWKAKVKGHAIQVPSGNVCLMRKVGLQVFMKQGIIPNSLMPIVQKAISQGKPPSNKDLEALSSNESLMDDMMELMDEVTLFCVIEPRVERVPRDDQGAIIPIGDDRRSDNLLYVDEVDIEDKMFIFNVAVGGTSDLERFRQESAAHMEDVSGR